MSALGAKRLLADPAAPYEHPVIDVNGRMAMMPTLSPRGFGSWIEQAGRDARERQQAGFVGSSLREDRLS